jgi:hypothetical protein
MPSIFSFPSIPLTSIFSSPKKTEPNLKKQQLEDQITRTIMTCYLFYIKEHKKENIFYNKLLNYLIRNNNFIPVFDYIKENTNKLNYAQMSGVIFEILKAIVSGTDKTISGITVKKIPPEIIRLTKNNLVAIVLGAAIVISVVFLWYFYAIELTKLNNLREFGLWIKSITFEEKIKTIKNNLISDFPELIFGWPLFILFLFLLKKIGFKGQIKHQIIIGFLGFLVFYMIAIERMQHHSYYFIALLPFLVLSILNSYRASGLKFNLLILICGLNFIWSFTRIVPSRWADGGKGIPEEFKNTAQRNLLTKEMKSSKISLVGPDVSGCVFFYFTNTKGYSFNKFDELFKERKHGSEFNAMLESGLDKILIYKTDSTDRLMASIKAKKLIDRVGDFEIWEINRKK